MVGLLCLIDHNTLLAFTLTNNCWKESDICIRFNGATSLSIIVEVGYLEAMIQLQYDVAGWLESRMSHSPTDPQGILEDSSGNTAISGGGI